MPSRHLVRRRRSARSSRRSASRPRCIITTALSNGASHGCLTGALSRCCSPRRHLLLVAAHASAAAAARPGGKPAPRPASGCYTPADFARFAPKTAYDMLVQVPGFTIRQRRPGARAWPGVGERPDQRPAHRQQVRRRDRRAAAHPRRERRADRDRRCRQPRHRRPLRAGRQRHPQGGAEGRSGQFEWNPSFRAHYAKPESARADRSATPARPARSTTPCRSRTSRAAAASAARSAIYDARRRADRDAATRSTIPSPSSRTCRPSSGSTVPARRSAT